jgi:hypothetical protein
MCQSVGMTKTESQSKAYWNPFADLGNGSYEKVYADVDTYVGKDVIVTRADGIKLRGKLKHVRTCANGALGLTLAQTYTDAWVSPDFTAITIVEKGGAQ